jgi:hypothetical protein
MPARTAAPIAERAALVKRDYTVPDYLTDWWYYGRLYPGCSCVISSAQPYSFTSYTETASVYNVTVVSSDTKVRKKNLLMQSDRPRRLPERTLLVEIAALVHISNVVHSVMEVRT